MNQKTDPFSTKRLWAMIIPLFLEQLLVMLVGLADTLIVSYAGEAAVSGVSLVNQFNTIFIYLFTALASGGAVVISQYIGKHAADDAGETASQLLSFSTAFSILIAVVVLIGNERMLALLFGKVENDVMGACITYLRISAYSYPALAIYNSGAAVFRSIGKTSVTMYLSAASNFINVIGNVIGVFVLKAGVAGVSDCPHFLCRGNYMAVLPGEKSGCIPLQMYFPVEREPHEVYFEHRHSQRTGKRCISVGEGCFEQHCGTVRYLSDCGKRCGAKHLVTGGAGGCFHGTGVYHGNRTVYGKWRYQGGR